MTGQVGRKRMVTGSEKQRSGPFVVWITRETDAVGRDANMKLKNLGYMLVK